MNMDIILSPKMARSTLDWFFVCYYESLALEDLDAEQVKFLRSICDAFGTDRQKKTLAMILNGEI